MRRGIAMSVAILILIMIAPVGGATLLHGLARNSNAKINEVSTSTGNVTPAVLQFDIVAPSPGGQNRLAAPTTASVPIRLTGDVHLNAGHLLPSANPTDFELDEVSRAIEPHDVRPGLNAATLPPLMVAAASEAVPRQAARCDPGLGQVAGVEVSAALSFTYTQTVTPQITGNDNYAGPSTPQANEPSLEVCITVTANPNVNFFADMTAKAPSDSPAHVSIDRLYLELRNALGVTDLRYRIGRDRVRLGPLGLLLDEVVLDGRDGFEVWLPPIGPVRLSGFFQYALETRSTTRRVWGGRAEVKVASVWTLGVNYRADTAASADAGLCPSNTCNTGRGFGVDLEGTIVPGLALTQVFAQYTQTGDSTRGYYVAELIFDLKELASIQTFEPVVTVWYKNLDPYTIPGADGSVPRGGFVTPDDIKLFNINDNLTAIGVNLELQLARNVAFFALGEWGTYKAGGPTYQVYSAGIEFSFPENITVKLTYNAYSVAGGSVITSPVSGLELSNATVYQIEFKKTW